MAAGVVVHQHTRVLMADLHRCGDNLSEADVREGVQQLTAKLAAAYEAAAVGLAELQRVVVEKKSGPQGKAAVDRRVAEANARCKVAWTSRALCTEALTRIRGQSRLAERATLAEQQAAAVVESQTAGMGRSGRGSPGVPQQSTTRAQPLKRQQKEKEGKKANNNNKKVALGARQAEDTVKGDQRRHQAALAARETNAQAAHGDSQGLQETVEDTLLEPTVTETSGDTLLVPTTAAAECAEQDMEFLSVATCRQMEVRER